MKLMVFLKSKPSHPLLFLLIHRTFQFNIIALFCCIYGFSLTAISQEPPDPQENPRRSYDVAYELRGIKGGPEQSDLEEPFYIRLENNQVNLSSFFQRANTLLNQSDTDNTYFIDRALDSILAYSQELCETNLRNLGQVADDCRSNAEMMIESQRTQMLEQQSRRVLFPRYYREQTLIPSQSKMRERVEQIRNYYINRGGCRPSYCLNNDTFNTLLYGSSTYYRQILDILNESGATKDCFTSIFTEIADEYWYDPFSSMPPTCQGLTGSDKKVCDQMQSDFRRVTNRIGDMIREIQPNKDNIHISLSCSSSSNSLLSNLKNVLSEIEAGSGSCENYTTGESRSPQHHQGWGGAYSIKKEPDGNYTVAIPIIFTPANDYDGDIPTDQIHPHYLQKTQECLQAESSNMLGPNGERLIFNITDGNSLSSCEKPNSISIQSRTGRSNSASYEADIDCPTTVHEIGHTMGLKDEYTEGVKGHFVDITTGNIHEATTSSVRQAFLLDYNCRVTQFNSLMGSHWERFESVERGSEQSLLDPTHFNVILYGSDCSSRDDIQLYQQCASLTHVTSYKPNSYEDDCPSEKQQCEASNVLGRDLEEDIAKLETQLNEKLDRISSINRDIFNLLRNNEFLSHILREATENLRNNPDKLRLFSTSQQDDIKRILPPSLYNGFDMFLEDRNQNLIEVIILRGKLRRLRSQL